MGFKKNNEKSNSKLNFKKERVADDFKFFKFDENDTFMGKFVKVLPDDHDLEGIHFEKLNDELESEGDYLIPSFSSLLNFFNDVEPNEKVVYRITKTGEKELKGNRKLFTFEIESAELE